MKVRREVDVLVDYMVREVVSVEHTFLPTSISLFFLKDALRRTQRAGCTYYIISQKKKGFSHLPLQSKSLPKASLPTILRFPKPQKETRLTP
jgi:hypothetical protein